MKIKEVTENDINNWILLSKEYDAYIKEIHPNFIEWYEGNDVSVSYDIYMKSKIKQKEAFMAVHDKTEACLGIIAFSKKNNRITFFGISHGVNTEEVGQALLQTAFNYLDRKANISMNIPKSNAKQLQDEKKLAERNGFVSDEDTFENGCPAEKMTLFSDE